MITSELEARAYISAIGGSDAIGRLEQLQAALVVENERQNLVSRGSLAEIWVRHSLIPRNCLPMFHVKPWAAGSIWEPVQAFRALSLLF